MEKLFEEYYLENKQYHKLKWHNSYGLVQIDAFFPGAQGQGLVKYDVWLSCYLFSVLLHFEKTEEWLSFKQLQVLTNLGEDFLRKHLLRLVSV